MDVEQLKQDVRSGRITVDRLIDLVVTLQRELHAAKQQLDQANGRIAELERQSGASPSPKVSEPFSRARQKNGGRRREERNGGSGSGGFGVGG